MHLNTKGESKHLLTTNDSSVYKPGVYYFCSQVQATEHSEFVGLTNMIKDVSLGMDLSLREHQALNILNRIRLLPESDQDNYVKQRESSFQLIK